MYYRERGDATELWARAAVLQPFDEIMGRVTPMIHLDTLWIIFQHKKFYLGDMPGPRDVARLLTWLHQNEKNNARAI